MFFTNKKEDKHSYNLWEFIIDETSQKACK